MYSLPVLVALQLVRHTEEDEEDQFQKDVNDLERIYKNAIAAC